MQRRAEDLARQHIESDFGSASVGGGAPPNLTLVEGGSTSGAGGKRLAVVTVLLIVGLGLLGLVIIGGSDVREQFAHWMGELKRSSPNPGPVVARTAVLPAKTATSLPTVTVANPTASPLPTATLTSTLTPLPEPAATEPPSPTPTVADLKLESVEVRYVGTAGADTLVDIAFTISNIGAGASSRPADLVLTVDEDSPEFISVVPRLGVGERMTFVFSRPFEPGTYVVTIEVGGAKQIVSLEVQPQAIAYALGLLPTQTPMPAPDPSATPTPAVRPMAVPTRTALLASSAEPTSVVMVSTETRAVTARGADHPHLRHLRYKEHMLELINEERTRAGLGTVVLGTNNAAQLHAEAAIDHCFGSHWGIDGLKPYMRYRLAGGYQSNAENGSGSDYCIREADFYRPIGSIENEVEETMAGWTESPGHRRNILTPHHKKVNVGLAWDRFNFAAYQQFEGDYIDLVSDPRVVGDVLSVSGRLRNGAGIEQPDDLGIQIFYDQPPRTLTRGQVSRTYCYDSGRLVAALREPLPPRWFYPEDKIIREHSPCPDPYLVPADAPAPTSPDEAREFWQAAYDASQLKPLTTIVVPWITADEWRVTKQSFDVTADVGDVLDHYGPGVYTIVVWAKFDGVAAVISAYSIFNGVKPPDTYDPANWR